MVDAMPIATEICDELLHGTAGHDAFPQWFGILGNSWLGLTGLALICSLLILVLVNMVANFLRNQQLLAWSKFELFQVLATVVLVIFSILWVEGMCNFDLTFLDSNHYPPGTKMDKMINDYFTELEKVGYALFGYLMFVIKQINFIAKAMWASNPLGVGSVDSPLESLAQINSLFFFMMSGYVTSFLLLQFQMRILDYMAVASIFFLYPFGIFFRAFEPTRSFGGTLIGIAIAMFLFYPIILVFNDYLIWRDVYDPANPNSLKAELGAAIGGANALTDPNDPKTPKVEDLQAVADLTKPDPQTGRIGWNPLVENTVGGVMFLLKPIMVYLIAAVILPVINFVVLVEITRGLTHFLGEEVDVSNLTRLI